MDSEDSKQISEALLPLIPEVINLKQLFLWWTCLGNEGKEEVERQVHTWKLHSRTALYYPLKEALQQWELIQDTEGAPGYDHGYMQYSWDPQLESEMAAVIRSLQEITYKTLKKQCEKEGMNSTDILPPIRRVVAGSKRSATATKKTSPKQAQVVSSVPGITDTSSVDECSGYKSS